MGIQQCECQAGKTPQEQPFTSLCERACGLPACRVSAWHEPGLAALLPACRSSTWLFLSWQPCRLPAEPARGWVWAGSPACLQHQHVADACLAGPPPASESACCCSGLAGSWGPVWTRPPATHTVGESIGWKEQGMVVGVKRSWMLRTTQCSRRLSTDAR